MTMMIRSSAHRIVVQADADVGFIGTQSFVHHAEIDCNEPIELHAAPGMNGPFKNW
ncbi:MAG: hypothetical protein ABJ327_25705 [Litoreibacter sp.]